MMDDMDQQELLRKTAKGLKLTQAGLADRMEVPWATFKKWLLPSSADSFRELKGASLQLVHEVTAHEKLKERYRRLVSRQKKIAKKDE
jgi:hypothetical protein